MAVILPKIDGLALVAVAAVGLAQSYTPTPKFIARTMDGTAKAQTNYTKLETVISGSGWMLTGWEALDLTDSVVLSCAEARTISDVSNVITIPAARRSDVAVRGFGVINGVPVSTPVNVVADVATLTVIGGESHFIVGFYPEFSAFVELVQNGRQSWTLTAREV